MTWTPERLEQLTGLWAQGWTASQIGKELGTTRNAIIGKLHRLGHSSRDEGRKKPCPVRREKYRDKRVATPRPPRIVTPPPPPADASYPHRKTLLELTKCSCRWPVGDPATPELFFCGAAAKAGSSYCASHHYIAHRQDQPSILTRMGDPDKHRVPYEDYNSLLPVKAA